jgi:Ca-activated chloride channel homolog
MKRAGWLAGVACACVAGLLMLASCEGVEMQEGRWSVARPGAAVLGPPPAQMMRRSGVQVGDEVDYNRLEQESYDRIDDNPFRRVSEEPVSTFSVDVDTAAMANVRRFIQGQGKLPPKDAVRIEEMINYFPYGYAGPTDGRPFAVHTETTVAPWNPKHRLVRIGIKGRELREESRPSVNLVFLIDTSGSMQGGNRLPLVKRALGELVRRLEPTDRVAIVTYAGSASVALRPTRVSEREKIIAGMEALEAVGSTAGAEGIKTAYDLAGEHFVKGGVNRVVLCTDGDFNVGITDRGQLTRLIETSAKSGVYLSVLGFGMGNIKDATLEELSRRGNGNYAYIDTISEARKVLVEQAAGTLVTIARDVKIQVEFNPATVAGYRLIGYENRMLARQDFNDDKKDAGEIGAGHTVTALFEVVPAGEAVPTVGSDGLKYSTPPIGTGNTTELMTVKLRYKSPMVGEDVSELMERVVGTDVTPLELASADTRFAAAVAEFGMVLRESPYRGTASLDGALRRARETAEGGKYREELVELIKTAEGLKTK